MFARDPRSVCAQLSPRGRRALLRVTRLRQTRLSGNRKLPCQERRRLVARAAPVCNRAIFPRGCSPGAVKQRPGERFLLVAGPWQPGFSRALIPLSF
jgi:hypothetical protein